MHILQAISTSDWTYLLKQNLQLLQMLSEMQDKSITTADDGIKSFKCDATQDVWLLGRVYHEAHDDPCIDD